MRGEHTATPWTVRQSKFKHDGAYDYAISATGARVLAEVFGIGADGSELPAEENAAFLLKAVNLHDELVAALRGCQSALAMVIGPDAINQTSVLGAFAACTAAEANARSLLVEAEATP